MLILIKYGYNLLIQRGLQGVSVLSSQTLTTHRSKKIKTVDSVNPWDVIKNKCRGLKVKVSENYRLLNNNWLKRVS